MIDAIHYTANRYYNEEENPIEGNEPGMKLKPIIILSIIISLSGCAKFIPARIGPPAEISVVITPERVALGKKLAEGIMACGSCHTTGSFAGDPQQEMYLAGDLMFTDNGRIAVPNITPDKQTGIGNWTDGEIIRAITKGLSRDNRVLLPLMPWASFGAVLTDEEAMALVAYLRTGVEPVNHMPAATELTMLMSTLALTGLIFNEYAKDPFYTDYVPKSTTAEERGLRLAYLGACVDCHAHAPKLYPEFGVPLAGGTTFYAQGAPPVLCANLTPDMGTGIGSFSDDELYNAVKYGLKLRPLPDADMVRWPMMNRMTYHTSLTDDEISDLIAFFRSQPAVENDIGRREKKRAEKKK